MAQEQPESRTRNLLVVLAITVVVGCASFAWMASPDLGDGSDLNKTPLALPDSHSVSKPLMEFLKIGPKRMPSPVARQRFNFDRSKWMDDPAALLLALKQMENPSLRDFEKAISAKGCLDPAVKTLSMVPLTAGAKLHSLRAIAILQSGKGDQAAASLHALFDRLLAFERDCSHNFVQVASVATSLNTLAKAMTYVLLGSHVSDLLVKATWDRLAFMEKRPSPVANSFRAIAVVDDAFWQGNQTALIGGGPPQVWPWYSSSGSTKLWQRFMKRFVWLANLPLKSEKWDRQWPEEAFAVEITKLPVWLGFFAINGTGRRLAVANLPAARRRILRFEQLRCVAAAQRARTRLVMRGQGLMVQGIAPANLFTGKPFEAKEMKGSVCAPPIHFKTALPGQRLWTIPDKMPTAVVEGTDDGRPGGGKPKKN